MDSERGRLNSLKWVLKSFSSKNFFCTNIGLCFKLTEQMEMFVLVLSYCTVFWTWKWDRLWGEQEEFLYLGLSSCLYRVFIFYSCIVVHKVSTCIYFKIGIPVCVLYVCRVDHFVVCNMLILWSLLLLRYTFLKTAWMSQWEEFPFVPDCYKSRKEWKKTYYVIVKSSNCRYSLERRGTF